MEHEWQGTSEIPRHLELIKFDLLIEVGQAENTALVSVHFQKLGKFHATFFIVVRMLNELLSFGNHECF